MEQRIRQIVILYLEIAGMMLLYGVLDTQGMYKYIILSVLGIILLTTCYKSIEVLKEDWDLLIPVLIHCCLGIILSLCGGTLTYWTFKNLVFWTLPPVFSYILCMKYINNRVHMIEIQFWGCVLAYLISKMWYIQILGYFESTFAFVFGLFVLYYAWKHQWIRMSLAAIVMYLSNKRIAVLAVACCLILMIIMKLLRYGKKWIYVFWSVLTVAIVAYVYSIHSGVFVDLCLKLGIDTSHRIEVYPVIAQQIPKIYLFGHGLGTTNEMLAEVLEPGLYYWFENPHNDFLKMFVDLGTMGFVLFLGSFLVVFYKAGKRISEHALSQLFVTFVYFMLLMTTDNVSIYILFLVPMYSICLALMGEKCAGS